MIEEGQSVEGGCLCEAIRYTLHGPILFCSQCCCKDCQKATGTGHPSPDRRACLWYAQILDGQHPLLTKTLKNVRTEMSLCVLAYNMKRMIQIIGIQALIAAIRT